MKVQSLLKPLAPLDGDGTWVEASQLAGAVADGRINRCFFFPKSAVYVISTLERAEKPRIDRGLEYHIAIAREGHRGRLRRATSQQIAKTLAAFGASGADEVQVEPGDPVRHYWMPIADHAGTALGPASAPKIIVPGERRG